MSRSIGRPRPTPIRRTRRLVALAVMGVLVLAACSTTKEITLPDASSPVSGVTAAPTSAPPSPGSSSKTQQPDPNGEPPATSVAVDGTSTASVSVTKKGGNAPAEPIEVDLDFTRMDPYSFYTGPKGLSSLTFTTLDGNAALTLGGYLTRGPQKTSSNAALDLAVTNPAIDLNSGGGSCIINVEQMQGALIAGSFRCTDAPLGKNLYATVSGTFSSEAPTDE